MVFEGYLQNQVTFQRSEQIIMSELQKYRLRNLKPCTAFEIFAKQFYTFCLLFLILSFLFLFAIVFFFFILLFLLLYFCRHFYSSSIQCQLFIHFIERESFLVFVSFLVGTNLPNKFKNYYLYVITKAKKN